MQHFRFFSRIVGLALWGALVLCPIRADAQIVSLPANPTFQSLILLTPLLAPSGGTGFGSYAVGDLLYADTIATLARLADVGAGSYLRSGGITTAPLWSTLVLPNAATAYRLPVATSANTIGELAAVGATGEYLAGATGAIPAWATLNQAAVAGLTTASTPTFAGVTLVGGNLVATDGSYVNAATRVITKAGAAALSGSECFSTFIRVTAAGTITACAATTVGQSFTVVSTTAAVVSVGANSGSDYIILNGTTLAGGFKATSDGSIGATLTCINEVANYLRCYAVQGVFSDGGA